LRHVATETPAGVLLQYAEEVEGHPIVGRAVRKTDDPAAAADRLLVRAGKDYAQYRTSLQAGRDC